MGHDRFSLRITWANPGRNAPRGPFAVITLRCFMTVLLTATPLAAWAAYPTVTLGGASGLPGSAIDLTVIFTPGSTPVSTIMIDLSLPSSLSYVSTGTGAAATAAGKAAQGTVIPGGVRLLIFGINQTQMGAGDVALVRLNISPTALPGMLGIGIPYISASDPNG